MSDVRIEIEGGVKRILLDRPEKKNALTAAMFALLRDALLDAERERGVRALLLHGAGGIFTAGYDVQEFLSNPPRGPDSAAFQFLDALMAMTKPVVAAVAGTAVGIGTTMLLHCDLVYAAPDTRFATPFASLGLCPEAGSSYLLPRLTGPARAAELLLLGEAVDAATAAQWGLVTRVVPAGSLVETAEAAARKLAALPARAVRATKALTRAATAPTLRSAMREETRTFADLLTSPEAMEAFRAFLEKRKPDFTKFD